jgi:hypothetical protein
LHFVHKLGDVGLSQSSQKSMQEAHLVPHNLDPGLQVKHVVCELQVKQVSEHLAHFTGVVDLTR